MATVAEIMNRDVLAVDPTASIGEAAEKMMDGGVGAVVVMEDMVRMVGIITERDILQRVVVPRLDPGVTLVQDVMTTELVCCQPHTSLEEARGVLKNRRIRHLPVVDEYKRLVGMISIGDLNAHEAHDHEFTIHVLQEYIYGRV